MTLQEIKDAIAAGQRVYWSNPAYEVILDSVGQYLIAYRHGERDAHYIGLTWRDGVTMNGREEEFFTLPGAPK